MTLYELTDLTMRLEALLHEMEQAQAEAADAANAAGLPVPPSPDAESIATLYDALIATEGDVEAKLQSICKLVREHEALAEARRAESKRLAESSKVADNRVARLKRLLKAHLEATGQTKARAGLFSVAIQANGGAAPIVWSEAWHRPTQEQLAELQETAPAYVELALNTSAVIDDVRQGVSTDLAQIGERGTHVRIR